MSDQRAAGQIPYGPVERDLYKLSGERAVEAMYSVAQLSDDPLVKLEIAVSAMTRLIGAASGFYAGTFGHEMSDRMKHKEFAIAVIEMAFEEKARDDGDANV